jgi:hypothetical protein
VTNFNNASVRAYWWDLAAGIVARREKRAVPLRLPNATGVMTTVSEVRPPTSNNILTVPYRSLAELGAVTDILAYSDSLAMGGVRTAADDRMYRIDRYNFDDTGVLTMLNHKSPVEQDDPNLGIAEPISPDFRYRNDGLDVQGRPIEWTDYVPVASAQSAAPASTDAAFDLPAAFDTNNPRSQRKRDIYLSRMGNILTTRSDVFTAYITLLDENGNYVRRAQVTLDRSDCFREVRVATGNNNLYPVTARPIAPRIIHRVEGSYNDEQ